MRSLVALLVLTATAAAEPSERCGWRAQRYLGWSAIFVGGTTALLGTALTTRADDGAAGLAPAQTAGWVLLGVGSVGWIGGALVLRRASIAHSRCLERSVE